MWRFLIDEDMSRTVAPFLRANGFDAEDVRDVGLRGRPDSDVFAYAQSSGATLISADKGFSNELAFPLGTHNGIIVVRVPNEVSNEYVNTELLRALNALQGDDLSGLIVIVESGRTRIRRPRL